MPAMAAARHTGRVVAAMGLVLVLAGCVRLDVDLRVANDDTVDGTVVIAIDEKALRAAGQDRDTLYATLAANFPNADGVTTQKYDEDGFAGIQLTLRDVPIANLPALGPAGQFRLTRDGDEYQFDAVLNLGTAATSGISIPEGLTTAPDLQVQVTFPGEVTATNGQKDGATARWKPTLGQRNELTATALATGGTGGDSGGASSSGWLVLVAVVGGLAVLTAALALFLTRRREQSRPVPLTPLPSDTEPPPPLSSLNRPEQPLPRPLPPPEPPE